MPALQEAAQVRLASCEFLFAASHCGEGAGDRAAAYSHPGAFQVNQVILRCHFVGAHHLPRTYSCGEKSGRRQEGSRAPGLPDQTADPRGSVATGYALESLGDFIFNADSRAPPPGTGIRSLGTGPEQLRIFLGGP